MLIAILLLSILLFMTALVVMIGLSFVFDSHWAAFATLARPGGTLDCI